MLLELTPSQSQGRGGRESCVHHRPKIEDTVSSSNSLLFLESEERSSLWFVLLLGAWGQGLALAALHVLGLSLAVDPVHPELHLLLVSCLEQVEATVCKSEDGLG